MNYGYAITKIGCLPKGLAQAIPGFRKILLILKKRIDVGSIWPGVRETKYGAPSGIYVRPVAWVSSEHFKYLLTGAGKHSTS